MSDETEVRQPTFLTVGRLREAMVGLPDEAQVVVTDSLDHRFDQGVVQAQRSRLIPWEHECADEPEGHRSGLDCPSAVGLDLCLNGYDEAVAAEEDDD